MTSSSTFGVHFVLRSNKSQKGKLPVYARVTVNGTRCELALKQYLNPSDWNAGKGIANPAAAILSAAMMLDWLGLDRAAQRIRTAVERALEKGETTPDLGGKLKTEQMGQAVADEIKSSA